MLNDTVAGADGRSACGKRYTMRASFPAVSLAIVYCVLLIVAVMTMPAQLVKLLYAMSRYSSWPCVRHDDGLSETK